MTDWTLND